MVEERMTRGREFHTIEQCSIMRIGTASGEKLTGSRGDGIDSGHRFID